MNGADTFLVDGQRLTADQCRELFCNHNLTDRQIKVADRIEGDTVLDIGCYAGVFVEEVIRRFPEKKIWGVDYFEDNVRLSRLLHPGHADRFSQMSAYDLQFPESHFDCVTLQEVLEHLEGAAQSIKEMNRVLKVGGVLIVSVPNPFFIRDMLAFFRFELRNAWWRFRGKRTRLGTEVYFDEVEWNRHIFSWTPQTLLTLFHVNGFEYVEHCYENGRPNPVARLFLKLFPFFGPTQILKVRKVAPAPAKLV